MKKARTTTGYLWLRCSESREGLTDTIDAVLEMTPGLGSALLAHVQRVLAFRAAYHTTALYEMTYWDGTPDWATRVYDPPNALAGIDALYDELDREDAVYFTPGRAPWVLPADLDGPQHDELYAWVEGCMLHVQEDGVYWSAYVQHSDIQLHTRPIPLRDLEAYSRGLSPTGAAMPWRT